MDYDSPWKEALEFYFQAFLALFFPHIHDDIDWSRGFVFLDKELQKLVPKAGRGRLYVDKLVKVWRKNGQEAWVLIHIEVQTQRDLDFPKRMFRYNHRIQQLFRVIDWLMELPPRVQKQFDKELAEYEEEHSVHFYDTFEKRGILRVIEDSLRTKFGDEGVNLMPSIKDLFDGDKYMAINRTILTAATVDEVRKACVKAARPRRKKNGDGKGGAPKR